MTLIKDLGEEEHLTEDDVETPAEEDAESYVGHMPDGEDDDVEDMLEETGMYQDADVEEVDVAKQVKKAELARRGKKPRQEVRSAVEPSEVDESETKDENTGEEDQLEEL